MKKNIFFLFLVVAFSACQKGSLAAPESDFAASFIGNYEGSYNANAKISGYGLNAIPLTITSDAKNRITIKIDATLAQIPESAPFSIKARTQSDTEAIIDDSNELISLANGVDLTTLINKIKIKDIEYSVSINAKKIR